MAKCGADEGEYGHRESRAEREDGGEVIEDDYLSM